jgi:HSP90 family molecular chaperone
LGFLAEQKSRYELSIHRARANLETVGKSDLNFVTKKAEIKVNPNLVKLLSSLIYNNDVGYGVRELLQNAVDACKERCVLTDGKGIAKEDAEIVITLTVSESNKYTFSINNSVVV